MAASADLSELRADIAVLPEWSKIPMAAPSDCSSFVEFGRDREYGVGVATWGPWRVTKADVPAVEGVIVGGAEIDGPQPFRLVAVWASLSGSIDRNPVAEALDTWVDWLSEVPVVVAGDFNTGGWWQKLRTGPKSHFPLVEQLSGLGLRSSYHAARGLDQGVGEEPTHWHNRGGSFMIDHIFTPETWEIVEVTVGGEDPWRARSDHAPIVAEVRPT